MSEVTLKTETPVTVILGKLNVPRIKRVDYKHVFMQIKAEIFLRFGGFLFLSGAAG